MPTENDLRDAFDQLASSAPQPDDVLANLPTSSRPVRRGRTPMVAGVVLATAAAAVAIPLVGQARQSTPPVAAAPPPAASSWYTGITVDLPPGMRYSSQGITRDGDHTVLIDTGRAEPRCVVRRYRPGGFDVQQIPKGATSVTVGTSRGFQYGSTRNPDGTERQGAVVWPYAENAWASSGCTKPTFEYDAGQSLEIARRSTLGRSELPSPVRVKYLPAGFRPTGVSTIRQQPRLDVVPQRFGVYASKGAPVQGVVTAAKDPGIRIEYSVTSLASASSTTYEVTDGRPQLVVLGKGFKLVISVPATLANGRAELDKIAANLDRAPVPSDPGTWFDAGTAIP
ncbi:hypothetical protein [Kribbella sp. DT2]|uniref:hypothetical protein n=1 Tax=Kribbella sp. DT2 TaxID=3393427 RepID=UPI003CECB514